VAQLVPDVEHEPLDGGLGPGCPVRPVGAIVPVDPIERIIGGPPNPALDGAQADPERPGHRAQRGTCPNGLNDRPALLLGSPAVICFSPSNPSSAF
jgi:hypothetical protein